MVEAYVLSIPDTQYGHRVGALVVLGAGEASLTLGKLRKDLAAVLAIYKLPTVLRVVDSDEELPRSPEGKLSRNPALQRFFPTENGELLGKVEVWNLGVEEMTTNRAWDWGGVV
jgi:malonyl-CoA/methylmalonyl-CoA synthetase